MFLHCFVFVSTSDSAIHTKIFWHAYAKALVLREAIFRLVAIASVLMNISLL